jgi:hypothetical protein
MIDLIISATVGGIVGFGVCAVLTVGKVADGAYAADCLDDAIVEATKSHARATDRGNTLQARIDRALACETPKAAHGVKKMAAILRGER